MAYDPSIFNINPYYDDFNDATGFLRVLFRPGYALQARELSQAQSILQNQVSKIGDHLFKDGSRIIGGGISVRTTSAIRITTASLATASVTDYSALIGKEITQSSGAIKAKIVNYLPLSAGGSTTHLVVVIDFMVGYAFTAGTIVYDSTTLTMIGSTESCKMITVGNGVFYVDGFFAPVDTQYFTPSRVVGLTLDVAFGGTAASFNALTTRVGFDVVRDTVTSEEDSTLRDPAIGSSNYNAPGGDRYKIDLILAQSGLTAQADDFIELVRFEEGKITRKSERVSYAEIEKTLSRRTYEESGSYVVRPFDLNIKDAGGATLSFVMGPGKAYIVGKETETQNPETLSVTKARTTKTETSLLFPYSFGNYVGVCMGASASNGTTFASNLSYIGSGSAVVKFRNNDNTSVLATGYVHGAIPFATGETAGHKYNLYLYGVSGSVAGASFGTIYSGSSAGVTWGEFVPSSGTTFQSINDPTNQSLLYEIPVGYAISNITSVRVPGRMWTTGLASGSGYSNSGGKTTFLFDTSKFSDSIASTNIDFDVGVAKSDVAVVNSQGRVFFPENHLGETGVTATASSMTLHYDGDPSGFISGVMKVFVPVIYRTTSPTTSSMRYKASALGADTSLTVANSATTHSSAVNGRSVISLSNVDVYQITGITFTPDSGAAQNITDYFELDDGQRETHYEYAKLIVKPSKQSDFTTTYITPNDGSFSASYKYFTHIGGIGTPFLGATAYSQNNGISYENIPLFTNSRTGKTVSLANCLDFRHSTTTGIAASAPLIKPYRSTKPTELSYTHFLPRIDKLCLRNDADDGSAEFFVVQGTPDMSPSASSDPVDSIVIGSISIPAYTHNSGDVLFTPYENKRYTMQDIGKIEKRIDEVEVFAKLSISEVEIDSRSIKTLAGASSEPLKTSIFSEEFLGHSIGDVASHEHICSIDYELGELRPFFTPYNISFSAYGYGSEGTTLSSDGLITINYGLENYITNTEWTKKIVVNQSNTVNWLGFASLSPSASSVYDTSYRPVTKTNALGENDNWLGSNANNARGFGTQWNDWESLWTGIEDNQNEQDDIQKQNLKTPHVKSSSLVPNINSGNERVGIERTIIGIDESLSTRMRISRLKNRIKSRVDSRIVDKSVVPYIPATAGIILTVHGLKPSITGLSVYFDGDVVKSGVSSDAYGSCGVTFSIPANTYLTGEKIVRISDSSTSENATTSAEASYYCLGAFTQRDSGSYSTRPPTLRRQTVSNENIIKNPFAREYSVDVLENSQWSDPLSQTFFVDKKSNAEGIFIKDVGLFFSAKDSALPVTIQIRPTVSGYPSPCVAIPFSTKTLLPTQVNADSENPTVTTFTFSSPIFLEPGEYAICIITNSNKYEVYVADSGYNALATGSSTAGRVGSNQKVGVLFTSTSMGVSVPENSTDLMFTMNRCEFDSGSNNFTATISNAAEKQVLKFSSPEIIPYGCTITRQFTGNVSDTFRNNENNYPTILLTGTPGVQYTLNGNAFVSPVIDSSVLYGTAIDMRATTASPSSYVSRVVSVDSALSNGLAVFVDENTPTTSSVEVYYRASSIGQSDILTKAWTSVARQDSASISGSDLEYSEGVYGVNTSVPFSSYQIKVVLSSTGSPTYHTTSAVRSIRATSFIR